MLLFRIFLLNLSELIIDFFKFNFQVNVFFYLAFECFDLAFFSLNNHLEVIVFLFDFLKFHIKIIVTFQFETQFLVFSILKLNFFFKTFHFFLQESLIYHYLCKFFLHFSILNFPHIFLVITEPEFTIGSFRLSVRPLFKFFFPLWTIHLWIVNKTSLIQLITVSLNIWGGLSQLFQSLVKTFWLVHVILNFIMVLRRPCLTFVHFDFLLCFHLFNFF